MSLLDIRAMRLSRVKPSGVVTIVVGELPKTYRGDPTAIELKPGCQPQLMDWRPLVGVWVALYHVKTDWVVMDAAVKALTDAGAKLFGIAHDGVGYPLANFADEETKNKAARNLRRELEALCL